MPDQTTILSLPLILPAQAQKHVTHNEALRLLDVIVQLSVTSRVLTAPPTVPADGARYIVAAAPTGVWSGRAGQVAFFTASQGWQFALPLPGWQAWVLDEGAGVVWNGVAWVASSAGGGGEVPETVPLWGVNATADTTNRLSVSAPATLLNHAGAGHQLKLNKAAEGDTASLLFQTGFSGRAEMGIAGGPDFSVKVSPNGSAFLTGLSISATTGEASLPQGALLPPGTVAAPGLRFAADPDTGLTNPVANEIGLVAGGALRAVVRATALSATVPVHSVAGTAAAPSFAFGLDSNTGFLNPAADQIGFVTGGTQRAVLTTTALQVSVPVSGTAVTQTATDTTAGRLLKVGDYGAGAAAGTVLFGRANVLGTVAQAAGVPTGAVLETASNANGRFLRMADGTLIAWVVVDQTATAWATATGSLFTSAGTYVWTYPSVFVAAPVVTGSVERADAVAGGVMPRSVLAASAGVQPWCSASLAAGVAKLLHLSAIGRWF